MTAQQRAVRSLADWCTISARRDSNGPCLVGADGTTYTNAEVAFHVASLAAALRSSGLRPGDRLAIIAADSPWYLILVLASNRAGISVIPINVRSTATEVARIAELTEPAAFVNDAAYTSHTPLRQTKLRLRATFDDAVGDTPSIAELARSGSSSPIEHGGMDDEAIFCIGLTSGTTGVPKAVLQSQRMYKALVGNNVIETGLQPTDRLYSGAPLFHVAGLGNALCGVARSASSVLLPRFDTNAVLRLMQKGGITFCVLMPTMIVDLLSHPDVASSDYEHLRGILYGGAPLRPELIRRLSDTFDCELYNGFGAGTEAGGQAMLLPADHRTALSGRPELLMSIGRAMFGVELKICDPTGDEVRDGVIGEIYSRSDATMSGYLGRPDLTASRLTDDGWFHAGDLARRDSDGYLYLAGRSDDMLVRGGENIYPAEVESVVMTHPDVADVAVVGLPDQRWGEIVAAVVVAHPNTMIDQASVSAHCRGELATFKIPTVVRTVDALPRNAAGKVVRSDLKVLLA